MKKNNAFSLVEIMILLVAVSVVLAAFTPVITKRIKPSIRAAFSSLSSPSSGPTPNCAAAFSSDCVFCDGTKKCYICNKNCESGTYKDTSTCSCELCSEIDPNCNSCSDDGICNSCTDGYLLQDNTCTPCPDGFYCTGGSEHQCPAGYYCINGIKSPCEPGKWSNAGSSSCTPCPEGSYCVNGIKILCADGKWSAVGRIAECLDDCPAGYACKDGVKIQCNPGTYSLAGASSCTACEEGFYCTGGSNRSTCESKTEYCAICDAISGTCSGCGEYSILDGTSCVSTCSVPHCKKCESGSCETSWGCSCQTCAEGYKSAYGGYHVSICIPPCPSGYEFDSINHCVSTGTYRHGTVDTDSYYNRFWCCVTRPTREYDPYRETWSSSSVTTCPPCSSSSCPDETIGAACTI